MRGILACWVRQADKIECFKKHQCNKFALHSKFNLNNGDILYDGEGYPHLQVITPFDLVCEQSFHLKTLWRYRNGK